MRICVEEFYEIIICSSITVETSCVYDVVDCSYNFDDGVKITSVDDFNHFIDWDIESNLYVKCKDEFENEPLPNQCSIIARTTNF